MTDLFIFALLFTAIAIGWLLGRRSTLTTAEPRGDYAAQQAAAGRAAALVQEAGSTQARIELGVQLRKQGEVDGAVRVHEALLAGPGLPPDDAARTRLELARDYISAGLLDRSEDLLLELVETAPGECHAAQRHLLDIYEIERDWQRAIDLARAMLPRATGRKPPRPVERGQRVALLLAQYCCELASEERLAGDLETARKLLQEALRRDRQCVRASLLLGQVEFDRGRYRRALRALRRVPSQSPDFLPESIELLRKCHAALGEQDALQDYLAECLAARPSPALIVAVAQNLARNQDADTVGRFLAVQLVEYPSLAGLAQLIDLQRAASDEPARRDLDLLQGLTRRLLATGSAYRCGHCGFSGKHLHWHCPGCKHWGSMKVIDGTGSL